MLRKFMATPVTHGFIKSLILPGTQNQLRDRTYNSAVTTISFNSNYTPKEEERILSTINKSNNEELGRWVLKKIITSIKKKILLK